MAQYLKETIKSQVSTSGYSKNQWVKIKNVDHSEWVKRARVVMSAWEDGQGAVQRDDRGLKDAVARPRLELVKRDGSLSFKFDEDVRGRIEDPEQYEAQGDLQYKRGDRVRWRWPEGGQNWRLGKVTESPGPWNEKGDLDMTRLRSTGLKVTFSAIGVGEDRNQPVSVKAEDVAPMSDVREWVWVAARGGSFPDDIKDAVIHLIVEADRGAGGARSSAESALLRAELEGMKLSALKKRAKQAGVDEALLAHISSRPVRPSWW